MGVLQRIRHDLKAGWAGLRYGAAQAANRALAESELLHLRLELRKTDDRLHEVWRDLGERAIDLHQRGEGTEQILTDYELRRGMEQVQTLQAERKKLLMDMQDVKDGG